MVNEQRGRWIALIFLISFGLPLTIVLATLSTPFSLAFALLTLAITLIGVFVTLRGLGA